MVIGVTTDWIQEDPKGPLSSHGKHGTVSQRIRWASQRSRPNLCSYTCVNGSTHLHRTHAHIFIKIFYDGFIATQGTLSGSS